MTRLRRHWQPLAYLVPYAAICLTAGYWPWGLIWTAAWVGFWIGESVGRGKGLRFMERLWGLDDPAVQDAAWRAQAEGDWRRKQEAAPWN